MVPMLAAEREVAGDILVRKWEMTGQLGDSVLAHHAPDIDDGVSFLVGVADVIGQILYPSPERVPIHLPGPWRTKTGSQRELAS